MKLKTLFQLITDVFIGIENVANDTLSEVNEQNQFLLFLSRRIVENKKMVGHFSLNLENSPKLKRLQVNEL